MSGLLPCSGCTALRGEVRQLETRVAELEHRLPRPNCGLCERCRGLRDLVRCVLCERDLCRDCAGTLTCPNALSGEHHTP
jgi:hypothetical protein